MRLITKDTDYAIRALCHMAGQPAGALTSAAELCRRFDLPRPYLRRILQTLARRGILRSSRGPAGGFALAKSPARIRVADVLTVFQGALEFTFGALHQFVSASDGSCGDKS